MAPKPPEAEHWIALAFRQQIHGTLERAFENCAGHVTFGVEDESPFHAEPQPGVKFFVIRVPVHVEEPEAAVPLVRPPST